MKKLMITAILTLTVTPVLADYWTTKVETDVYSEKESASMAVGSIDGTSFLNFSCDTADKVTVAIGVNIRSLGHDSVDEALAIRKQEVLVTIKSPMEGLKSANATISKWNANYVAWSTQDFNAIGYWVASVRNANKTILVGVEGITVAFPAAGSTNAMDKFAKVCGIKWL